MQEEDDKENQEVIYKHLVFENKNTMNSQQADVGDVPKVSTDEITGVLQNVKCRKHKKMV